MRIDGLFNVQQLNPANVLDILGRFGIGDVIKAKILEMTTGELMLKLFDGTVFKAATAADIDARPGDVLDLAVTGKGDGSITLETVRNPGRENLQNDVKKLLISLGIAPEPGNIELAGEFKAAGVKIDPGIFNKASELIRKFSELTPEKAVFLVSRDIKPGEGGMDNLIRLLEGRLKLGKQLDELQKLLSAADTGLLSGEYGEEPTAENSAQIKDASQFVDKNAPRLNRQNAEASAGPRADADTAGRPLTGDAVRQSAGQSRPPVNPDLPGKGNLAQSLNRPENEPAPAAGETAPQRPARQTGPAGDPPASMPSAKAAADTAAAAARLEYGRVKGSGVQSDPERFKKLVSDLEKAREDFKSLFVRTDSGDLKTDLEVKKIYRDLAEKLDTVRNAVLQSGIPGAEDILARVNSLDDGLKLLSQINSSSAYFQIPLNLSGFNTTGELYVMKRDPRRKKIDPGNVTMFISLDTQNIGRIEAITEIKGRNISLNLRAEDQGIIDFIKENFKLLYNGLAEKGYRLVDVRYRLLEDAINPASMDKVIRKELDGGRVSIDMKI